LKIVYIADDGTFTVEVSRTIEESPIGAPTESEILRKENVEEIGLWRKNSSGVGITDI
jgi:hypothetical protein